MREPPAHPHGEPRGLVKTAIATMKAVCARDIMRHLPLMENVTSRMIDMADSELMSMPVVQRDTQSRAAPINITAPIGQTGPARPDDPPVGQVQDKAEEKPEGEQEKGGPFNFFGSILTRNGVE